MSENLWPYNPESHAVAKAIAWADAHPLAFQAKASVWKKLMHTDADKLRSDIRFRAIFSSLSAETQEIVNAVAERRPVERQKPVEKAGPRSIKDDIISRIEAVMQEAEEAGDITGQLRGVELIAKMHALLSQKTSEDDRVVNITVDTGVRR